MATQEVTLREPLRCDSESPEPSTYCTFSLGHEGPCSWEVPRVSSVPEEGFQIPKNCNDLTDLSFLAHDILVAASKHVNYLAGQDEGDAWDILLELRKQLNAITGWMIDAKWAGEEAEEKAA